MNDDDIKEALGIVITQLGQLIDITMFMVPSEHQAVLDYAHNQKGVLLADLSESQLAALKEEMRQS